VVLVFSNGTQKQIPASSSYNFLVVLPSSGFSPGSSSYQADGINLSDSNPIDVEFISTRTLTHFSLDAANRYSHVSVYWFTVQGQASVSVKGMGAGF
jgi:hypothetical protein